MLCANRVPLFLLAGLASLSVTAVPLPEQLSPASALLHETPDENITLVQDHELEALAVNHEVEVPAEMTPDEDRGEAQGLREVDQITGRTSFIATVLPCPAWPEPVYLGSLHVIYVTHKKEKPEMKLHEVKQMIMGGVLSKGSLLEVYKESSWGKSSFTAKNVKFSTIESRVSTMKWYSLQMTILGVLTEMKRSAPDLYKAALIADQTATHFMIFQPGRSFQATAELPGMWTHFKGKTAGHWSLMAHELGHNYGADHSGAVNFRGEYAEYNDDAMMGYAVPERMRDFNVVVRFEFGWITPDQAGVFLASPEFRGHELPMKTSYDGLYELRALNEGPKNDGKMLVIAMPCDDCVSRAKWRKDFRGKKTLTSQGGMLFFSLRVGDHTNKYGVQDLHDAYPYEYRGGKGPRPDQRMKFVNAVHVHFRPDGAQHSELWDTLRAPKLTSGRGAGIEERTWIKNDPTRGAWTIPMAKGKGGKTVKTTVQVCESKTFPDIVCPSYCSRFIWGVENDPTKCDTVPRDCKGCAECFDKSSLPSEYATVAISSTSPSPCLGATQERGHVTQRCFGPPAWKGSRLCQPGLECVKKNDFYGSCQQPPAPPPPPPPPAFIALKGCDKSKPVCVLASEKVGAARCCNKEKVQKFTTQHSVCFGRGVTGYDLASFQCSKRGMRLCTPWELGRKAVRAKTCTKTCGFKSGDFLMWTSEKCTLPAATATLELSEGMLESGVEVDGEIEAPVGALESGSGAATEAGSGSGVSAMEAGSGSGAAMEAGSGFGAAVSAMEASGAAVAAMEAGSGSGAAVSA